MKNWKYINGAEDIVVGNKNYRYKDYLITKSDEDGEIIVYKPNGRDVAFRGTESEAVKFLKTKVGNSEIGNELNTGDFFKRLASDAHKEEARDNEKLNENGIKRAYAAMKKTGNEDSYEAWKNKPAKKIGNSVYNLFLKFPSYEEAEDYINTKLKNKYKSVKVISKPHNGNGTYEIIAED